MPVSSQETISPSDLKRRLDGKERVLVLDVREPEEFNSWHIPEAINFPLGEIFSGKLPELPPDIVTVCSHGNRSSQAALFLSGKGLHAVSLEGGMVAWNSVYETVQLPVSPGQYVLQFRRVGKGCLSYLLAAGEEALVVDPTLDIGVYLDACAQRALKLWGILDTHAHADHVSGARLLAEKTGVPYYASFEISEKFPDEKISHEERIPIGKTFLSAHHTPGHTPESMTYLFGSYALTGDTLFVESVGRPDLGQDAGENAKILYATLHQFVSKMPSTLQILPGHVGEKITLSPGQAVVAPLAELKTRLAPLRFSESEFVSWVLKNSQPKPSHFEAIKSINLGKTEMPSLEEIRELEAGPNRCAVG